jgi:hypothetical protein
MLDSFEANKVLGAVLGTCLGIPAVHLMAGAVFAPQNPAKPGYEIEVRETPASRPAAAPKEEPFGLLLAKASVERGQAATKPCEACHTVMRMEAPIAMRGEVPSELFCGPWELGSDRQYWVVLSGCRMALEGL